MRIDAYIFYSEADKSVHMFTYRKNIDEEKTQGAGENTKKRPPLDEMTEVLIRKGDGKDHRRGFSGKLQGSYSFFIIVDIDNFIHEQGKEGPIVKKKPILPQLITKEHYEP